MEKKFLEDLGLEPEIIEQIMAEADKNLADATVTFEAEKKELQNKLETANNEVTAANETINQLNKTNKNNADLQKAIEEYKVQLEEIKQKSDAQKIEYAVDLALEKAGAINPITVKPLIDMEAISLTKDGQVTGVMEQLSSITSNDSYKFLFRQESAPVEAPKAEVVERGGYEPLASNSELSNDNTGLSLGAQMAQKVAQVKNDTKASVSSFWSTNN